MSVQTTAHINFRGDARAALGFYAAAVGGQTTLVTYEDQHSVQNRDEAHWIMWGQVEAANGFRVMAFDVPSARPYDRGTDSFFIALRGETVEEITAIWEKLAAGATILTALAPAPWAPDSAYGMLTDRFGVTWIIDVLPLPQNTDR
jgi:PhnB protein